MNLPIPGSTTVLTQTSTLTLSSPAFEHERFIPSKYTCEGENVNPPLRIENIPAGTKSLALIVDDPDAAGGTFIHWLVWNIRPAEMIWENSVQGTEGINNFGTTRYQGPCPPTGTHRYSFKVYVLDDVLDIEAGSKLKVVEKAMKNHILNYSELVGFFRKTILVNKPIE